MGQSIGSTGNSHKQKGAGAAQKNQPGTNPGQRQSDQDGFVQASKGKPDGGAEKGARGAR
jgi:hypothetical protein